MAPAGQGRLREVRERDRLTVGVGVPTVGIRSLSGGYGGHSTLPTVVHVQADPGRRGPGWARNQCIAVLYDAGCDLIVLMDDDCYPVRTGWQDHLANGMTTASVHVVTLDNTSDPAREVLTVGGLVLTTAGVGCFLALTRHAVDTVGYFSAAFEGYGFEDAHYLARAARSGINGTDRHVSLVGLTDYIRSEDLVKPDAATEYLNMTRAEKDLAIGRNLPAFEREMADPRIYRNRSGV